MLGPILLMLPLGFLIAAPVAAMLVVVGRRMNTLDSAGRRGT